MRTGLFSLIAAALVLSSLPAVALAAPGSAAQTGSEARDSSEIPQEDPDFLSIWSRLYPPLDGNNVFFKFDQPGHLIRYHVERIAEETKLDSAYISRGQHGFTITLNLISRLVPKQTVGKQGVSERENTWVRRWVELAIADPSTDLFEDAEDFVHRTKAEKDKISKDELRSFLDKIFNHSIFRAEVGSTYFDRNRQGSNSGFVTASQIYFPMSRRDVLLEIRNGLTREVAGAERCASEAEESLNCSLYELNSRKVDARDLRSAERVVQDMNSISRDIGVQILQQGNQKMRHEDQIRAIDRMLESKQ